MNARGKVFLSGHSFIVRFYNILKCIKALAAIWCFTVGTGRICFRHGGSLAFTLKVGFDLFIAEWMAEADKHIGRSLVASDSQYGMF